MKKLLTLLLICLTFLANAQSSWNMNLLGTYDYPTTQGNDIWGWVDASQNEFAIVGLRNGISCVNVTNPSAPFEEFFINDVYSIWRDIKTYGNYAYVTTESDTGLLIIDLTDMTGNTFWHVKDFMNPITGINLHWEAAHDLFIDENGVCYIFGASNPNSFPAPPSSVIFLDVITNPTNPIHLGQWIDPQLTTMTNYVHDGMVRGDTMYTGNIYSGKVFIIDVSDKASPVTLGSATTPNAFTHNAWVSDNGNYVFTTDEKPDAYLAAFDISNLNNIQEVDRIQSNPGSNSIPHNTFVDGNFLITSYYTDGTTVHDITYPNNMIQVAYYDSYSGSGPGYNGCWGTYPYLPSGNIISSDVNSGAGGKGRLLIYGRNFQQASFLSGTVTNSNTGFPISNTTIQIVSTSYTTTTNLLGGYSLGSVNSGIFQVLFSATGYIPIILNVTLSSGNMIILDAALSPGSGLPGCTDTSAVNYDPNATIDDGNCIYCNGTWVSLNMFDTYGDGWNGNTWTATSTTGGASYGPYTISNGSSGIESFCLPDDCYDIVCGNGTWQTEVSWTLTDPTGGILLSGGAPISIQYAIGLICAVYGCMDSTALNYYAGANVDDGTCLYVPGCMDATACNYDPLADVDDGSCEWTSCAGVCANLAPAGLHTTNVVQNRATINWDNMNDANCMVDQYRIKFRAVGSSTFTQKTMGQPVNSCLWAANNTDKLILNLTPSTQYEYQMKAWYCYGSGNGVGSVWTALYNFTTEDDCPNVGNLAVTTPTTTKATFTWNGSNGAYSFTRIKARVDTNNGVWFNVGGLGVNYGIFTKNKNGLNPGTSYRAQARTWCDPNGGAWKSPQWTSLIYWTQPTVIRLEGGNTITNLAIYPNPSRDIFNVTFTSEDVQDLKVRAINVIGEELISDNPQQFSGEYTKQIDLTNNAKGIYFLEITTNNGVVNKKLILQ